MNKKTMPFIVILSAALLLGIFTGDKFVKLFVPKSIPTDLAATLLERAKPLSDFQLLDHNNQPIGLAQLKSKWTFMFFGYTHCPDVCPLAMRVMQQVWKQLGYLEKPDNNVQMYFVSVDPDRDTPELLKQYATHYNPNFIGVTGKSDQIDVLTGQLGILYGFGDPDEKGDYHVNHSGQIVLIDPQGNMRGVFSPPHEPQSISRDFLKIREYVE